MTTGTVMLFISPDGRVIAHAADFDQSSYGGFTVAEAQAHRCRRSLESAVFDAFCSPVLVVATDPYVRERVVEQMADDGYKRHTVTVEVPKS